MISSSTPLTGWATRRSLLVGVLALCSFAMAPGCNKSKTSGADATVQRAPAVKEVPAPANRAADLVIHSPGATYGELRSRLQGPMKLLPGNFSGVVVTLLGISPQVMPQINENADCYGVLLANDGNTSGVLGLPLRSGSRTIQLLTAGANAKYKTRKGANGITFLDPRPDVTSRAAALAVGGNYLLLGQHTGDLDKAAAYVAGTLPKWKPKPADPKASIVIEIAGKALHGEIATYIENRWKQIKAEKAKADDEQRAKHGGREPDFGDPKQALASIDQRVSRALGILRSLSSATVTLTTTSRSVDLGMFMKPSSKGAAFEEFASLTVGKLSPMLRLPESTVVAYMDNSSRKERAKLADERTKSLSQIFGKRLGKKDADKLSEALHAWAKARGENLAVGIQWVPKRRALLLRSNTSDTKAFDDSVRALTGLLAVSAIREPLATHVGRIDLGKPSTKDGITVIEAKRTAVASKNKAKKKLPPIKFQIAWHVAEGKDATVAIAEDGSSWVVQSKKVSTMRDRPDIVELSRGLDQDVAAALFIDPRRLLATLAFADSKLKITNTTAPILGAYGRTSGTGWVRLHFTNGAASEVFKMLTGSK